MRGTVAQREESCKERTTPAGCLRRPLNPPNPACQGTLCHGSDHSGEMEQLKVTVKERFDLAQPDLSSPVEEPRIVHTLLRSLGLPRHNRWPNIRLPCCHLPVLSARAVAVDGRIHDIAAGDTAQTSNPHRQIALPNVNEVIPNHQSVASGAVHGILLANIASIGNLCLAFIHFGCTLLWQAAIEMPVAPLILLRVFAGNRRVPA